MTSTDLPPEPGDAFPSRQRFLPWIVAGAVVALLAAVGIGVVLFKAWDVSRPVPDFPRLADSPDESLTGTVAYTAPNGCVRVVAAAGSPSKDVLCLTPEELTAAPAGSKLAGPQLRWRDDGRLEITMFRWAVPAKKAPDKAPDFEPAWQKLVQVRTGEVEDVPSADLPSKPRSTRGPQTNRAGQHLSWSSEGATGRIQVRLTDAAGTRVLLDARGPGKYAYGLDEVYWAPSGDWVVADDGRILSITTGSSPRTRVLVEAMSTGGSGGTVGPKFAVTDADLVSGS